MSSDIKDSMIQIHAKALNSLNPTYHVFLQRYNKSRKEVYGFVEGKDDPNFYKNMILALLPSDWEVVLFVAKSRKNVLDIYSKLDNRSYLKKRVCYFIDRDLSEFLEEYLPLEEDIFVTEKYSIENYIVNFQTFFRIIEEILNYNDLSVEQVESLEQNFNEQLETFNEIMTWWMTQILIWISQKRIINLPNLDLNYFFKFEDGKIYYKYTTENSYDYVDELAYKLNLPISSKIDLDNIHSKLLAEKSPIEIIRGKFLMWFLVEYLLHFKENCLSMIKGLDKKKKVNQEIGHKNAVINIAPRARAPQKLKDFITNNYISYINNYKLG